MSILKQYCNKHNIVLHKGKNIHILLTLVWNRVLLLKLRIHKWLFRIHHPIVHYYALCWNEECILPFVLDYYSRFADKIIIFDNFSTDHSRDIISSYPNTKVIEFGKSEFDDTIHNQIKNSCWKQSRGKADFVVVCDMDEFIFSPNIAGKLKQLEEQKNTIVQPEGYNMFSKEYPSYQKGQLITNTVTKGIRSRWFDKCILFDPHAIVEINYKPGAHECYPWGKVKKYRNEDIKLLHYKNIGLNQILERNRSYAARLSKDNLEKNYGTDYLKKEQLTIQEFKENEQKATKII